MLLGKAKNLLNKSSDILFIGEIEKQPIVVITATFHHIFIT
jgi:hypothetical protein